VPVRIRLRDVYGDLGQMGKAAAHMIVLADLYAKRGMQDQSRQVLQSALGMDPKNAEVRSRLGIVPAAVEPAREAAPPAFAETPSFQEPAPTGEIDFYGLETGMPPLEEEFAPAETPTAPEKPVIKPQPRPFAEEAPAPPFGAPEELLQEPAAEFDIGEKAEAEFYYQQGCSRGQKTLREDHRTEPR
jgi:hypothetical protein